MHFSIHQNMSPDYINYFFLTSRITINAVKLDRYRRTILQCHKAMIGEQNDIRDELKPIDRRMATLKKHIGQADSYLKYKAKRH